MLNDRERLLMSTAKLLWSIKQAIVHAGADQNEFGTKQCILLKQTNFLATLDVLH